MVPPEIKRTSSHDEQKRADTADSVREAHAGQAASRCVDSVGKGDKVEGLRVCGKLFRASGPVELARLSKRRTLALAGILRPLEPSATSHDVSVHHSPNTA